MRKRDTFSDIDNLLIQIEVDMRDGQYRSKCEHFFLQNSVLLYNIIAIGGDTRIKSVVFLFHTIFLVKLVCKIVAFHTLPVDVFLIVPYYRLFISLSSEEVQ